ncbi:MAG: hypothetical protein GXP30_10245 [Verrucomicrobia bacterium]|nr:hypothetical protein [Verrucomicrobiota bacterium]
MLLAFAICLPTYGQDIASKKFLQHSKVLGSEKCIECHESEIKALHETKHYANKDLHKDKRAAEIARNMGISSPAKIQLSGLCTQCHFTVQKRGSAPAKAIGGVSCESCHEGAKDWLDLHNTGDRRDDGEKGLKKRVEASVAAGLLYPFEVHKVATNCYSCHIVTDEKLVNIGGHSPGSTEFELVSWLKGEVRHNFFESKGSTNAATPKNRQRQLYVVGKALEMEFSMRGLARATEKADYYKAMGRRCVSTRKKITEIIETLGDAAPAELKKIQEVISTKGLLSFENAGPLTTVADEINKQIAMFVKENDGSKLGALDALIPAEGKGTAYTP